MCRTRERGAKARLSFSGGSVNMADSMEKVNVGGKNAGNGTFAALYSAIFRTPSFCKSLKFFGTSIASLGPETVQLPAFPLFSAMFTGACGPPEKLSLALAPRFLRMIVQPVPISYPEPSNFLRRMLGENEGSGMERTNSLVILIGYLKCNAIHLRTIPEPFVFVEHAP